jgi:HSP20 family protein
LTEKKTARSQSRKSNDGGTNIEVRPNAGLASIFQDLLKPFDEFFQPLFEGIDSPLAAIGSSRQPILDVQDRGDHFSVTAELPGFTRDEVEVKVAPSGIELRAVKTEKKGKEDSSTYQRSSRSYYQYLSLPEKVNSEKIGGTMKNGILELKLPKRVPKPKDETRRVDLK